MRTETILFLAALSAAVSATASIPTGARFGAWHVVSITSVSGTGHDDATAMLIQDNEAGKIRVDWEQGRRVVISMRIDDCHGEDEDFSEGYSVEPAQWLRQRDGGAARLQADFSTWLDQARLGCRSDVRLDLSRLEHLPAAAADFSSRLGALSGLP